MPTERPIRHSPSHPCADLEAEAPEFAHAGDVSQEGVEVKNRQVQVADRLHDGADHLDQSIDKAGNRIHSRVS